MLPVDLIFSGKIIYLKPNQTTNFILPFAKIYKIYKFLFQSLLKLMWKELICGQIIENEINSLLLFGLFLLLALFGYYFEQYISIFIVLFIIIWLLDYFLAKNTYLKNKNEIDVTITQSIEKVLTWKIVLPDRKLLKSEFLSTQICQVRISQKSIYGGAFQEFLGKIWQIELIFWDGSELVIYEDQKIIDVFRNAKTLAQYFEVPIIFQSSQGYKNYVEETLNNEINHNFIRTKTQLIGCRSHSNKQKYHIYSQWNFKNSKLFIKQLLQESGFLLFVILMTKFMTNLGQLIHLLITSFTSQETIIIPNLFIEFTQSINFVDFSSLLLALPFILFKGWKLSQIKHIYIDKYYLKSFINNQKIDQIETKEIDTLILIKNPEIEILILGLNKTIIINNFQQLEDAQSLLAYLQACIKQIQ